MTITQEKGQHEQNECQKLTQFIKRVPGMMLVLTSHW